MAKVLMLNLFIPVLDIFLTILEYERILSVRYRLLHFDYGIVLPITQLAILFITFSLWRQRKYRWVAVGIFVVYILLLFFGIWLFPPVYLYD